MAMTVDRSGSLPIATHKKEIQVVLSKIKNEFLSSQSIVKDFLKECTGIALINVFGIVLRSSFYKSLH